MQQSDIRRIQEETEQVYNHVDHHELGQNAQAIMLAEIALQLTRVNEHLESIAKMLHIVADR